MKKVGQPLTDPIGRLARTAGCFGGGIALLLLFCSPSSGDTVTQEGLSAKRHLQSFKQRFEKELYGTETHFFPIELSTREFLRVDIQSLNIDLAVSIVWPSRQQSSSWCVRRAVPTPICMIADASGTYGLQLRALRGRVNVGRYRLDVLIQASSTGSDEKRVTASRALLEAELLRRRWNQAAFRESIWKYKAARDLWHALGDRHQKAWTLNNVGDVYELLSEHEKALFSYSEALRLHKQTKDNIGEITSLNAMSLVYISRGENRKALETSEQALQQSRVVSAPVEEAQALSTTGYLHYVSGNMDEALVLLNQALELRRSLHDVYGEAETLLSLGYVHHATKENQKAQDFYQRSLKLWQDLEDLQGQGLTLSALGNLCNVLGDRQHAQDYLTKSIELFQAIGDRSSQTVSLEGLGSICFAMGERQRALDYYSKVLALARELKDQTAEAFSLTYIASVYRELGKLRQSLEYSRKALHAHQRTFSILGQSYVLTNMGRVFEALGDSATALDYFNRALELCRSGRERFHEGFLLNAVGNVYFQMGDTSRALEYYRNAFALQRLVTDFVGEPDTLYNLARAERHLGNLANALQHAQQGVEISETLRGKVASQGLRASFLASMRQQYELSIDLLMRIYRQNLSEDDAAVALQTSERARARSLLESLTETHADIRQGVDRELLERERSLQQRLNAKAERQMRLLGGTPAEPGTAAIAKEISDLTTEYEQVQGQIRAKSPRYAALTQPQPLSLKEIQEQVLDEESLLLEYALGDDNSYLWAVTKTGMTSHTLPKRAEMEMLARNVYGLLIARQPKPGEAPRQYRLRVERAEAQYWEQAATLSQMVLGPVADQLGTRRLLIVAEGALQFIPFGALPVPEGQGERVKAKGGPSPPLILEHEIVSLPSASALAVIRREMPQRKSPTRAVAVLADPVFEADDPRISRSGASPVKANLTHPATSFVLPPAGKERTASKSRRLSSASPQRTTPLQPSVPASELSRALRDVGIVRDRSGIPRLLSTRQEAEAIMAVTPAGAGLKAIDFKASRATALSSELGEYRIVHFATHGLLNSENPGLSGIVLSLVDDQGRPQDGFLRLHDIYNLNLSADLVVLSACNTGLGKDIKGEGLVGMVRGFMYAGAPRVVASLWKVDDEATAELMKHFYRQMFQENQTPAAALKAAQIALWQQKQWQFPYYWAAFTLQGEWK